MNKYQEEYEKYKIEYAAWDAEEKRRHAILVKQELERRRLLALEAELSRQQRLQDEARVAAQKAAQAKIVAAQKEYARALQARQELTQHFYAAFQSAFAHVKYEAALHGVTAPDDVVRVFAEGFRFLPMFQHADAGLLRAHASDPRVAAILNDLPPMPELPPKPRITLQ